MIAAATRPAGGRVRGAPTGRRRPPSVLVLAGVAIASQFVLLLRQSLRMWGRGELTWDFSVFHQAAWLIAHGHPDPYDSVRGMPFVANNAELIIWPLSLLERLPGGGWWLLAAQDAAIAATAWVAVSWISEAARSDRWSSPLSHSAAVVVVTLVVVADPLAWRAGGWDFHTEIFGGWFALATARSAWRGERRAMWVWAGLTLCAGDVAALYLLVVAAAGLAAPGASRPLLTRRPLVALAGASLGWLLLVAAVGWNRGSNLAANYGYMALPGPAGLDPAGAPLGRIAAGAVAHPSRWLGQLRANGSYAIQYVGFGGMLGLLNPWGLAAVALIVGPDLLAHGTAFAGVAFQNEPAIGFLAVGTVFALAWMLERARALAGGWRAALVVSAGAAIAWTSIPSVAGWASVSNFETAAQGAAVAAAAGSVPAGDEVVASQSIIGRFAGRPWAYAVVRSPQVVPVHTPEVAFVLQDSSTLSLPAEDTMAVVAQVRAAGGTVETAGSQELWVLRWRPPAGTRTIVLRGPETYNITTDPTVFAPAGTPPCVSGPCGTLSPPTATG